MERSMSPVLKTICIFLSVILAGAVLSGFMYSWTDPDGVKHFSNIAPSQDRETQQLVEEKFILPVGNQFKVTKIFDGDTIRAEGFGLIFTIRLVGIDTPELGKKGQKDQPYSREAKQKLTRLLGKKTIGLKQYGTGGYNRVLAEVFVGSTNVNLELVRSGLAEVYRGKKPNGFNSNLYFQAEKLAKQSQKGMWRQGTAYKSPRQWRKKIPLK